MIDNVYTNDIKLASILAALGIPYRQSDPITCQVTTESGIRREQYTFWFDTSGEGMRDKAKELMGAYNACRNWSQYTLPQEHPLYYMKGALENREVFLNWMRKKVAPQKLIQNGSQTILVGEKASQHTKDKLKGFIR